MLPSVFSAIGGALALAFIGFVFGGWVTSGKTMIVADELARKQIVAALVPICIEQSKRIRKVPYSVVVMKEAISYKRNEMLMQSGWATMPGASEPNRVVGETCTQP